MLQHKILLVDDTPSILKALKRTFKEEGYQILSAESADEAESAGPAEAESAWFNAVAAAEDAAGFARAAYKAASALGVLNAAL